ncbi:MAG: hypothetical protein WD733_26575 [Bryobacterales bacterium]
MASASVKIGAEAHQTLRRLAREEGESEQAVLERAVEHYRRERFLQEANAGYAALKKNRKAWKQEQAERSISEQTLSDGLKDE